MANDPLWKRLVGAFCGLGIAVALLLLFREGGVSGEELQEWQTAIVMGAGAAAIVLWLVMRQRNK
jgi:hypothetical protein